MNAVIAIASLFVLALIAGLTLWSWQKAANNFDLMDVLVGDDGKASLFKIGQAAALAVSTWGFVIQVQQGKLTEIYFLTYMGIWTGANLAKTLTAPKAPQESPP